MVVSYIPVILSRYTLFEDFSFQQKKKKCGAQFLSNVEYLAYKRTSGEGQDLSLEVCEEFAP